MPGPLQGDVLKEIEGIWGKPVENLPPEEKAKLVEFLRVNRPDLLEAWYLVEEIPEEQAQQLKAREASRRIQRTLLYEEDEQRKKFLSKEKVQNLGLILVAILVFGAVGTFFFSLTRRGGGQAQPPPPPAPAMAEPLQGIEPPPEVAPPKEEPREESPLPTPPRASTPRVPELPSLEEVPAAPAGVGGPVPVYAERPAPSPVASIPQEEAKAPSPVAVLEAAKAEGGGAFLMAVGGAGTAAPVAKTGEGGASPVAVFLPQKGDEEKKAEEEAQPQPGVDLQRMEASLAALRGGAEGQEKGPLAPGTLVEGRLATEVSLVEGVTAPVVVETSFGSFLGEASLVRGLVQIGLSRLVAGGRVVPLKGVVMGETGTLLSPSVEDLAPSLAQDLLRAAFSGVSTYVEDLRNRQRVFLKDGGVVVERDSAGLWEQVAGALAAPFRLPPQGGSFVRVYRLPKGKAVRVLVQETGP